MFRSIPILIIAALGLLLAVVIGASVGTSDTRSVLVMFITAVGGICLAQPTAAAFLAVVFFNSGITAPGIPEKLNAGLLFASAVVLLATLRGIFVRRPQGKKLEPLRVFIALFAAILVMTMAVRGMGFRILGGSTWGGMFYVVLFILLAFAVSLPKISLPAKLWPRALIGMGLMSGIPIMGQFLGAYGFPVWHLAGFIPGVLVGIYGPSATEGMIRFNSASVVGSHLLLALLVARPLRRILSVRGLAYIPLIFVLAVVVLASGSRVFVIAFALTLIVVMVLEGAFTAGRLFCLGLLLLGAWILLVLVVDFLPLSMQRSLSSVPGISVRASIASESAATVDWRFLLWRHAFTEIPHYWLVGKGYAFSAHDAAMATGVYQKFDELAWAKVTSAYHNGPLSLLIGLGVGGLFAGLGIMFSAFSRYHRFCREPWNDLRLRQCHLVFYGNLIAQIIVFIFLYGDTQVSFPPLLFTIAIIEGIRASDRALPSAAPRAAATAKPLPPVTMKAKRPRRQLSGRRRSSTL